MRERDVAPYLEELDEQVAIKVFGFPEELVMRTDFPLPNYSSSANAAVKVLERMEGMPAETLARFNARLDSVLQEQAQPLRITDCLRLLDPYEISKAAIQAL
ncbi:hypothetical protein QU487_02475 [Crenobacter sp. SG2305]|uniref:hypothetical protein n=1 Tax=Crenobacter oryzisoli TaxID=3056844 RepID=UPI0025AA9E02|nr:hypothetical protein [Crenobacter sp. SG2305]MDN0081626.1 hypothetical protein [Crenobacter sp. SG2305]